jgi:putative acetyltransferase
MKFSTCNTGNIEEIKQLFTKTFSDSEGPSEGLLIGNLAYDLMTNTNEKDLYYFTVTENKQIVGSIIFSRLTLESKVNAFLLAPVAIDTSHQRKGLGQKLINYGLKTLKDKRVELAVTYGDPKYYSKVGFTPITEKIIKAPLKLSQPEGWLARSLVIDEIEPITGNSYCVEALNNPKYW